MGLTQRVGGDMGCIFSAPSPPCCLWGSVWDLALASIPPPLHLPQAWVPSPFRAPLFPNRCWGDPDVAPNEMNKAPQPTGPPPAPSPGLPQVIREELAETAVGVGRPGNRSGTGSKPSGFSHPHLCQGKVQLPTAKLRQGPLAVPRDCHGERVCGPLRLLPQICPLLHQLGFLPHLGFPSC